MARNDSWRASPFVAGALMLALVACAPAAPPSPTAAPAKPAAQPTTAAAQPAAAQPTTQPAAVPAKVAEQPITKAAEQPAAKPAASGPNRFDELVKMSEAEMAKTGGLFRA